MAPHRFAEITQRAEEFFELAPIGMAILRLEDPAAAQLAEVMRSGVPATLGERPGQDDPPRLFTVTSFPIPPDCVGLVFEDITERRKQQRRAHESEIRYRRIFEASTAAICMFNARDGTFIEANPRFVEMLGLGGPSQLLGRKIETFGFWTD